MATPTPMKHGPSQQGRTPGASAQQHGAVGTPPVSTPFSATQGPHSAFSPHGPKSSPSHFKRSPANSNTLMGHTGGGSSGPPVNFDSPTAAAALGALGLGGGLDLGLDAMGPGALAELGRTDDDEDRLKKLQDILAMLSRSKGRVSEVGLERLAKSIGLETLWEEGVGGSRQTKTLVVAGSALALEIVMTNNMVDQVALAFPGLSETVTRHEERASRALLDNVKLGRRESPLCKMLDEFALNLERLALMDKLSTIPGFSCQEAVAGVYESLRRLYDWDMARAGQDAAMAGRTDHFKELAVLCEAHGRPGMHVRGRVGLTLDYWRERHLVPVPTGDPDPTPGGETMQDFIDRTERTWGIWVGCSSIGVLGYPPARVSTEWLSPTVEKQGLSAEDLVLASGPVLDWQQPPSTILPSGSSSDDKAAVVDQMAVDGMNFQQLPNVMFTAELEPPLVMSLTDSDHVYAITQSQPSYGELRTFDNLVLPDPNNQNPLETRTMTHMRDISIPARKGKDGPGHGAPSVVRHKNSLYIYKPVYGRVLRSVPFSHPSQLVDMLPLLRQYALLSTLLEKSFGADGGGGGGDGKSKSKSKTTAETSSAAGGAAGNDDGKMTRNKQSAATTRTTTARDDYLNFLTRATPHGQGARVPGIGNDNRVNNDDNDDADDDMGHRMDVDTDHAGPRPPSGAGGSGGNGSDGQKEEEEENEEQDPAAVVAMDVTLTAHPVPRLQVNFPFRDATGSVVLDIRLNGKVHIVSENVLTGGEGGHDDDDAGDVAAAAAAAAGGGPDTASTGDGSEARRKRAKPQDLGRILQICEDLDEWCEWMRTRLG